MYLEILGLSAKRKPPNQTIIYRHNTLKSNKLAGGTHAQFFFFLNKQMQLGGGGQMPSGKSGDMNFIYLSVSFQITCLYLQLFKT